MKQKNLETVKKVLLEGRRLMLTTHVSPDGDGISAELALYHFLRKLGKEVQVINRDPIPDIYAFLPGAADVVVTERPVFDPDVIVVTDCGGLDRAGFKPQDFNDPRIVVIDHHLTNDQDGDVQLCDPQASATGELVYYLLREMEQGSTAEIDYPIALCLYTAIFTDTGSFRYSNTSPAALRVASELVAYGINSWDVAEAVYESKAYPVLRLAGNFLRTLGVSSRGRFAWGSLRKADYLETGARDEHTDGFVNYPRSIKGVEVAIFFRETNADAIKVSMRSKGKINVAALAEKFGGGGHHNAAGCTLEGSLETVQRRVLGIVAESLDDALG
jgi:phosphoesterase RecJ-like protein